MRVGRPECKDHGEFCCLSVYNTSTGVLITFPFLSQGDLAQLYSVADRNQRIHASPDDKRSLLQARVIIETGGLESAAGLQIVEMGCSHGYVLYNLRQHASNGGSLTCFEADPHFSDRILPMTLSEAEKDTEGVATKVYPSVFNASKLSPNSVDVFTSSHVIEHWANPCLWIAGLQQIMKPGGIIFTEATAQYMDPHRGITRGLYHLTYFSQTSFIQMMKNGGFELVPILPKSLRARSDQGIRFVFRKPFPEAPN